jgi:hypothetical protein
MGWDSRSRSFNVNRELSSIAVEDNDLPHLSKRPEEKVGTDLAFC